MTRGQRPDVILVANAEALARAAAERMLVRLPQTDGRLAVCLAGGSTPERLYSLLASDPHYRDAVPWRQIRWFWGDDRFVPESDPRSNAGIARRLMLDRVPVRPADICAIPIGAENVAEAARIYEMELQRHYGADRLVPERPLFDIVLMGLGADGHTASLFPGHAELDETERWVVGVPHAGLEPFVPRVTLTFPALASTREMLFLVSGAGKRDVLGRVLAGANLPAARAYSEGDLVWLVDQDAMPALSAGSAGVAPPLRSVAAGGASRRPRVHDTRAFQPRRAATPVPSVIVVMGVSGSGKSTVAAMLAQRLGWSYEDADWFHPPSNIEKMHAGHPLTDDDRLPWLDGIAAWIKATREEGGHGVIACSALKRAYRDVLVAGRGDVSIVYLKGDRDLIARRFSLRQEHHDAHHDAHREQHFMPASLIDSQFAALEEPAADEHAVTVSIDAGPRAIVEAVIMKLGIDAPSFATAS
jgi:6-phosphogluconolactonase